MAGSLRDQVTEQYEKAEVAAEEKGALIDKIDDATIADSARVGEANSEKARSTAPDNPRTEESKAGRTANRLRDESGRLLPGKKESAPQDGKASATDSPAIVPVVAEPVKPKINRPSSWKKDHWESFDKLAAENPALAEYINQREGDYAKGVSTYKQQWDTAKPILDAIAPYKQILDQHRIDPAAHVNELMRAHHTLVMGSPQEKLSLVARIIQQNKIPVEQLFVTGQDGKLYFNHQLSQQAQQPAPQVDVGRLVEEKLSERETQRAIQAFEAEAQAKYPHYETVKQTMVGILQAGLASDLPSAYEAALRLPQHSDIWQAQQEQQRLADEKTKREEAAKVAARARSNAVSPKTATPTGAETDGKAKGRRAALEAAFEQHTGGGRV